ncbi:hypothetical protein JTE90_018373 [Oedothorax gibbosus]|uniref:Cation efflux protein transmembrane domain-containing protein n=1 Tax=Oedothorax gibbosus TaxID=931172 RepID=A0AAV6UFR4_9ARAC|nr:hypothetical protein JTE90_018373 [Oedothorax gibbosus]
MEELRQRNNSIKAIAMSGKVFGKHTFSAFSSLIRELKPVYKDNRFKRIVWLGAVNFLSLLLLLSWCSLTRSMSLLSYTYLTFFDSLCLCICALSIWVEQKKPNSHYTFGYERFEVLALFLSTTFTFISSIFIIRKSIWRWIQKAQIHTGLLIPGIILSFCCHMLVTYCMKNKGLNLVICASDSSWLQDRISSLYQSLSRVFSGPVQTTWPRINPFVLVGFVAGGILVFAAFLIDIFDYQSADAIAGIAISVLICFTMYPLSTYSGKVLLQGTPPHVKDLLDKCLREMSTLDGVLEFRNEHFWLLGFDKIVGTLHVRIRRDANEQVVLSHLLNKLSSLVTDITIQIFKDDWTWSSGTRQILPDPYLKFPTGNTEAFTIPNNATTPTTITNKEIIKYPHVANSHIQPKPTFAQIPLPPSLSKAQVVDYAIDMTTDKQMDGSQRTYSLQSVTSSNKYSRELMINPMFTGRTENVKSYRS